MSTDGWIEIYDDSSCQLYYYNELTGETSWTAPENWNFQASTSEAQPDLTSQVVQNDTWIAVWDENSGSYYYCNTLTGETQWTPPENFNDQQSQYDSGVVGNEYTNQDNNNYNNYEQVEVQPQPSSQVWTEVWDESYGRYYYFNEQTGETLWENPNQSQQYDQSSLNNNINIEIPRLHEDWEEAFDENSNKYYYINKITGETQWEFPTGVTNNNVEATPDTNSKVEVNEKKKSSKKKESSSNSEVSKKINKFNNKLEKEEPIEAETNENQISIEQNDSMNEILPVEENSNLSFFSSPTLNLPTIPSASIPKQNNNSSSKKSGYIFAPDQFMDQFLNIDKNKEKELEKLNELKKLNEQKTSTEPIPQGKSRSGSILTRRLRFEEEEEENLTDLDVLLNDLTVHEDVKEILKQLNKVDFVFHSQRNNSINISNSILSIIPPERSSSAIILSFLSKRLATHFSMMKYGERYFQYDRRTNNSQLLSPKESTSSNQVANLLDKLLSYQQEPLRHALTSSVMHNTRLNTEAISCFHDIQLFMTPNLQKNESSTEAKTVTETHNHDENFSNSERLNIALRLLQKLLIAPSELHDEVYSQLCKQIRRNNVEMTELGWQLFLILISCIPPSKRILPHLINFISSQLEQQQLYNNNQNNINNSIFNQQSAQNQQFSYNSSTSPAPNSNNPYTFSKLSIANQSASQIPSHSTFTARCLQHILHSSRLREPRKNLPSAKEIQSLLLSPFDQIQIKVQCIHGICLSIKVNSYTLVKDLNNVILKKLKINKENSEIFSLYDYDSLSGIDRLINPEDRVVDILTIWESTNKQYWLRKKKILLNNQQQNPNENQEDQSKELADIDKILLLSFTDNNFWNHSKNFFLFRIKIFLPIKLLQTTYFSRDKITKILTYSQLIYDVVSGNYPHSFNDACLIAAIQLQINNGDYIVGKDIKEFKEQVLPIRYDGQLINNLKFSFLEDDKSKKNSNNKNSSNSLSKEANKKSKDEVVSQATIIDDEDDDLEYENYDEYELFNITKKCFFIIPNTILNGLSTEIGHNSVILTNNSSLIGQNNIQNFSFLKRVYSKKWLEFNTVKEIENQIIYLYKKLNNLSKLDSINCLLSLVGSWKLYGAKLFKVVGQKEAIINNSSSNFHSTNILSNLNNTSSSDGLFNYEVILAVTSRGISIIDSKSLAYLYDNNFEQIYSWGHSFDTFIYVTGTKSNQIKHYFKTTEGKNIEDLLRVYGNFFQSFNNNLKKKENKDIIKSSSNSKEIPSENISDNITTNTKEPKRSIITTDISIEGRRPSQLTNI